MPIMCKDCRRDCATLQYDGKCLALTNTDFIKDGKCPFYCSFEDKKEIYEKYGWDFRPYQAQKDQRDEAERKKKRRNHNETV